MTKKFLLVMLISSSVFLSAALPAHAGGMPFSANEEEGGALKMPDEPREEPAETAEENGEAAEKMPLIEYDEAITADEPEEERARTWPWIIIGFLGAVFISAL